MCAIDALGVAEMLGVRVLIRSADPSTGEPVSASVDGGEGCQDAGRGGENYPWRRVEVDYEQAGSDEKDPISAPVRAR
jgi:hypothetical protein